ncbi:VirB3 family type IV secretion system protein [Jannaschia aquimarina]|uniref:Type IV secretory pathway, VirB3-like protein n=1 Tax=Jannaschia aquimarina TaxID=935700 RepID=A0A0D1EI50_9RHOB|nr:VirB3 family type IV secretion system protein [Jannaschia aquimarina]KIT16576.1 hypothetical protein jaqu_16710 [Jannaschia aquimarina]SNT41624.1 Type IV secretory pathway, VirB3 components [Jannaschia aquimarina]
MIETPFYSALTQSSRLLGLPYGFAIPFMGFTVMPLIWSVSAWTLAWCEVVYIACRIAARYDEKIIDVLMTGFRVVPGTRTRGLFGGDSYGP